LDSSVYKENNVTTISNLFLARKNNYKRVKLPELYHITDEFNRWKPNGVKHETAKNRENPVIFSVTASTTGGAASRTRNGYFNFYPKLP